MGRGGSCRGGEPLIFRYDLGLFRIALISWGHDLHPVLVEHIQDPLVERRIQLRHCRRLVAVGVDFVCHGEIPERFLQHKRWRLCTKHLRVSTLSSSRHHRLGDASRDASAPGELRALEDSQCRQTYSLKLHGSLVFKGMRRLDIMTSAERGRPRLRTRVSLDEARAA